jgi:hypothetical protein
VKFKAIEVDLHKACDDFRRQNLTLDCLLAGKIEESVPTICKLPDEVDEKFHHFEEVIEEECAQQRAFWEKMNEDVLSYGLGYIEQAVERPDIAGLEAEADDAVIRMEHIEKEITRIEKNWAQEKKKMFAGVKAISDELNDVEKQLAQAKVRGEKRFQSLQKKMAPLMNVKDYALPLEILGIAEASSVRAVEKMLSAERRMSVLSSIVNRSRELAGLGPIEAQKPIVAEKPVEPENGEKKEKDEFAGLLASWVKDLRKRQKKGGRFPPGWIEDVRRRKKRGERFSSDWIDDLRNWTKISLVCLAQRGL